MYIDTGRAVWLARKRKISRPIQAALYAVRDRDRRLTFDDDLALKPGIVALQEGGEKTQALARVTKLLLVVVYQK